MPKTKSQHRWLSKSKSFRVIVCKLGEYLLYIHSFWCYNINNNSSKRMSVVSKSANQKIKILYLMKILLEFTDDEHGLTLEEISAKLATYGVEAERKTLYDDLETLQIFGLDIEKRRDKSVRYYIAGRDFELPELKLLVDAVQSSRFITHKKSAELIKKIESFASHHQAQQLQHQVFVANRIKTMNESIYYNVDFINDAINQNVKISFQHFNWNVKKEKVLRHGGKRYVISPWALVWQDENYYMVGYDPQTQDRKNFRVDKMVDIRLLDEKREGEEVLGNFDPGIDFQQTFGMYGGTVERVSLRCHNDIAGAIIDRFGLDLSFFIADPDHFDIHISVRNSPVFLAWLLTFGDSITILSPENVKADFINLAKRSVAQYE